jgi:hypothetical protein
VSSEPLKTTKRRISAALIDCPGVAGVGLRGGQVIVYVESDDPAQRAAIARVVATIAPAAPLRYEVSGRFRAT